MQLKLNQGNLPSLFGNISLQVLPITGIAPKITL